MFTLTKANSVKSSREQIKLKGVSNDILLLPDNKYRLVLEVSSINFELKSEDEQDVIINNYQNFLNALPCSVQILFRVRSIDLDGYLDSFKGKIKSKSKNDQFKNYKQFVKHLVSSDKILSRTFYIVIPIDGEPKSDLEIIGQQLKLLEDIIRKGLGHLGIKTRKLSGLEILDLFYSFYNPEKSKTQSITTQALDLINKAVI